MESNISEIKIRPWDRLQNALPPLSKDEFEELKNSIEQHGVLQKILVLPDGRIIDGHHRWKILNGKVPPELCEVLELSEEAAFTLGVLLNLARRNLSPEQVREAKEHVKKLALELRKAGKSQLEVAKMLKIPQQTVSYWEAEEKKNTSNTSAGNACIHDLRVSVSKDKYQEIYEKAKAGEPQAQIAADYKISQQRVSQIIKIVEARRKKPEPPETPAFPEKKYRCLVIDPPWPIEKIEREERPNQGKQLDYPTMTLEEIAELPIPKLADPSGCHVYLWVTHKFLPEGLRLFEKWGVKYQCVLTWVKPTGMTPFSWMYNTEHVLFGRIGSLDLLRRGVKLSFFERSRRHSEKPEVFYRIVELVSPEPRLEMFARRRRPGFDAWGDEVVEKG
jgi:N6-adenosine-specific RNA methylase IME4/ParB-like chromosome segregation protein Spo0J